jgi:hypothetical protein
VSHNALKCRVGFPRVSARALDLICSETALYMLDLRAPDGAQQASDFQVRDRDVIYLADETSDFSSKEKDCAGDRTNRPNQIMTGKGPTERASPIASAKSQRNSDAEHGTKSANASIGRAFLKAFTSRA